MTIIRWQASYTYPGLEPAEGFDAPEDFDPDIADRAIYVLASDYEAVERLLRAAFEEIRATLFCEGVLFGPDREIEAKLSAFFGELRQSIPDPPYSGE